MFGPVVHWLPPRPDPAKTSFDCPSMSVPPFNALPILNYLQLPESYAPSPEISPVQFLNKHIRQLPPHLLAQFSSIISPKDRTVILVIRNRRLIYANSSPKELSFVSARSTWPTLWEGRERRGQEEGREEKAWAESGFLQGSTKHIGKLGKLLGEYEEEREAERVRTLRRERAVPEEFVPEEDESDEDEEDEHVLDVPTLEPETQEEAKASFERRIRERFIYGLLEVRLIRYSYWEHRMINVILIRNWTTTRSTGMIDWIVKMTEKLKSDGLTKTMNDRFLLIPLQRARLPASITRFLRSPSHKRVKCFSLGHLLSLILDSENRERSHFACCYL